MSIYDSNGNIILSEKQNSILNNSDIFIFGDSNMYYSAGNKIYDIGSFYQRLSLEFKINSWTNLAIPGKTTWQVWSDFDGWAIEENVEKYNKESTIIIFGCATNDNLDSWSAEYNGNTGTTIASNAVHFISEKIETMFPKVRYFWSIPTATDWSKWTQNEELDSRNMDEKMPYIIERLGEVQFPYCDLYHASGVTPEMLSDGVHWGGGGYNYNTDSVYKVYRAIREFLINK